MNEAERLATTFTTVGDTFIVKNPFGTTNYKVNIQESGVSLSHGDTVNDKSHILPIFANHF